VASRRAFACARVAAACALLGLDGPSHSTGLALSVGLAALFGRNLAPLRPLLPLSGDLLPDGSIRLQLFSHASALLATPRLHTALTPKRPIEANVPIRPVHS
jgi:hypothetical protein